VKSYDLLADEQLFRIGGILKLEIKCFLLNNAYEAEAN